MTEQAGRRAEGEMPIAWWRAAGESLIHRDEDSGLFERRFLNGHPVQVLDELPPDAVPLVPATDGAQQLPALDTPEALRYAADVVHATGWSRFRVNDTLVETLLRDRADQIDAEREARIGALANALLTADGSGYVMHYRQTATGLDDLGYRLDPTQAKK